MSQYTWVTNKNCTTLALVKLGSGQLYPLQESISNSEIIENDFPLIIENYIPHPFFFLMHPQSQAENADRGTSFLFGQCPCIFI